MAYKEGVPVDRLFDKVSFLSSLLRKEVIMRNKIENKNDFEYYLNLMKKR